MNVAEHFEDDDLVLYAMRFLGEPDALEMARKLANSKDGQQRLAAIQMSLAVYAEASTDLQQVPESSLERLMGKITEDKELIPFRPAAAGGKHSTEVQSRRGPSAALTWIGWGIAACLTVVSGIMYQDRRALETSLSDANQQLQTTPKSSDVSQERNILQATVAVQAKQIEQLSAQSAIAKLGAKSLRSKITNQTATVTAQQASISDAERQRTVLQETVRAQANQVAGLTSDAVAARKLLETLTDTTALRVTLTKPKGHTSPTGSAVYVAERQTLVFLANSLAPLKAGKVYELWLMPADKSSPVAAGTFLPDSRGNASLIDVRFPRSINAKGFSVTIEREGGAQIPTLPIILASVSAPAE